MSKFSELIPVGIHSVGIAGHIRPDGDCVGAVLGIVHYLHKFRPELDVDPYLQTLPEQFRTVPGVDFISTNFEEEKKYDLFIAADCSTKERMGGAEKYFDNAEQTLCIDHHVSNGGYAMKNVIEPEAGSDCEILADMMQGDTLNADIAACLYMGMASDTGVFRYAAVTPKTMRLAADLMVYGFDHTKLLNETFYGKSYIQTQVLGRALMESMLIFDKRCVVSVIKKREMEFYGVDSDSMDGIVSQLLQINGVEVAIFMYEIEEKLFKVSLRSKSCVDVNAVAVAFGGGGHKNAAGCSIPGTFYEAINQLTMYVQKQMD